jgi:general secretion pathway protein E
MESQNQPTDQLASLVREIQASGENPTSMLKILEERSDLTPERLISRLSGLFGYNSITYDEILAGENAFDILGFSDALQRDCVLLRDHGNSLILVFANVFDEQLQAWAVEKIGVPFNTYLAQRADIQAYLVSQEESLKAVDHALADVDNFTVSENLMEELSLNSIDKDESRVVKLVRSTLYDALKASASDIHIETMPEGLAIRYRLDGVMSQMGTIKEKSMAEQVISRVKVMAELDITETRIPQDGRFRAIYKAREIDFRVSVMPSVYGEDVVVRILDKKSLPETEQGLHLGSLGLDDGVMSSLRRHLQNPYGMILVTGPTGSGKTTTLYAAISEINRGFDKIITIEDPVEYELPGVLQIPVNEKKGLSFARGLRSILRHDPDKIMVGEIRDAETAHIAIQSALTGHLVLTTVHANNVFDVIGRFLNMGVDPYSFVSALNVIIAQRLIRTICHACGEPVVIDQALVDAANSSIPETATLRQGRGCGACRGTGYKGRRAVAEILILDDELREMIASRPPIRQLKEQAQRQGTLLLRSAALELAWQGVTTIEEVNRVTSVA